MVWSIRAAHGVLRYSAGITAPSIVGEPAAALPCVVMAHGFSGTMDRLFRYAERFATAGMAVLVFDYRNFGASGGQPRQLIDIPGQQADWRAAIGYARNHQAIDPQRTALWGSSLGGAHAVTVAAADRPGPAAGARSRRTGNHGHVH